MLCLHPELLSTPLDSLFDLLRSLKVYRPLKRRRHVFLIHFCRLLEAREATEERHLNRSEYVRSVPPEMLHPDGRACSQRQAGKRLPRSDTVRTVL